MAISIKDRIKQGTNTAGSGTLTLHVSYSASGFQDFSVLGNNTKTYYAIEEIPSKWEVGIGTYSGTQITRDTVLSSSNSNNKIDLGGSGTIFVTYPAEKAVFADESNVVSATGVSVGITGIIFNDGTTQTTAAGGTYTAGTGLQLVGTEFNAIAGTTAASGIVRLQDSATDGTTDRAITPNAVYDMSGVIASGYTASIQATGSALAADIAATGATNAAAISGKDNYNYWKLKEQTTDTSINVSSTETVKITGAGLVSTSLNAGNRVIISGASPDLSSYATTGNLAATGATNASGISANTASISNNTSNIAATGNTNATAIAANTTNIALTGATNAAKIAAVSGIATGKDNYQYWTITDGAVSENITTTSQVKVTGSGATTVAYNAGNNTLTINTPSSEAGYDGWTATDGSNTSEIGNADDVRITGAGNTTVSFVSGSPNIFTVSGTDQDLSSYATTSYVTGVSGNLQTQITDNIYTWKATGVHGASASGEGSPTGITISQGASLAISGTSGISVNLGTGTPDKFVVTHDDTSAGAIGIDVSPNYFIRKVQVDEYGHVTGLASAEVTGVGGGGGGSYNYWTASDGSTTTNISSTNTVTMEGAGNTTVTLSGNTYTISGSSGGGGEDTDTVYAWSLCGADVPSGTNVTISGGTGIQVNCGLATTISTTGVMLEGDGYDHWILQTDGSCGDGPVHVEKGDAVQIQGAGSTTVCKAGKTVTVSGEPAYSGWYAKGYDSGDNPIENYVVENLKGVWITGVGSVDVIMRTGTDNVYYTVSGIEGEAYSKWRATDGVTTNDVIDNELVTWTGVGNASVSMTGATFSISGADTIYSGGSGIVITGTESPYTIHGETATTGVFGMTYLDHDISGASATTAATPSGVRDYVSSYMAQSGYDYWTITDGSNSENISGRDTVNFTGAGATTVAYDTSTNTVTVSSTDNNTTYTAGDGLELDGTEFNVTGMALADSAITVNTENGLQGGGTITLGGTGTITGIDATTSAKGVVQLQDSAEDGVVDKAITPNAVYDISGALTSAGYQYWNVSDGSTSENISGTNQVIFAGAGATTTSYNTGNNTLTITSTDSNTTYSAGTGLYLDPSTTFNVSGATITHSGIVQLTNTISPYGSGFAVTPYGISGLSGALQTQISSNDSDIATNVAKIGTISGSVDTNTTNIATNTAKIGTVSGTADTNTTNIATNTAKIGTVSGTADTNTTNIATNTAKIGTVSGTAATNTTNIATNTTNIATNTAKIGTVSGTADTNTTNIATNTAKIGTVSGTAATNTTNIATNTAKIGTVSGTAATNTTNIATNTAKIATISGYTLDDITDNGSTTTNGINVGMIDTSGVRSAMQSGAGSSPGDTRTLDLSQASTFHHSMNQGLNTIALSNVTAGQKFMLRLKQNASATGTVGWFTTIRWAEGGTAPTLTATTSKTDTFGFLCVESGSYDGFVIGQNI